MIQEEGKASKLMVRIKGVKFTNSGEKIHISQSKRENRPVERSASFKDPNQESPGHEA